MVFLDLHLIINKQIKIGGTRQEEGHFSGVKLEVWENCLIDF